MEFLKSPSSQPRPSGVGTSGRRGWLGCFDARIMAVEPQDRTACAACGAKQQIMKRCTRCKAVVYCSRDCQTSDWQTHRLLCGPTPQHTIHTEDTCSSSGGEPELPLRSGARVHPDGRYEAFAGGNRCDERGFPMPKTAAEQKSSANKQVRPCVACGGQGKTSSTCEGIVRTEYCTHCEGDGAVLC